MTDHYYSRNPKVESSPTLLTTTLRNESFTFKTDQGVFSKKDIDFGSRLLIESFELPTIQGPILDIGCGYGPIGISLAKSYPDRIVHMVDVNERAIGLTKENAVVNKVPNTEVYVSDRLEGVAEKEFSAIVTNPPIRAGKRVIYDIFEKSYDHLADGGYLYIVIQKKQGAPSAKTKLAEVFEGMVETVVKDKGYFVFKVIKR
ncbi:class I SAM-dependent methyltransferase [Pseudogracilibacillus auburnensis]|uniref:class I SAM-dependent methyltransferase n=1 Tax=Pseudogracilibacillus auburnensis TaxID=1494959 RepID=UPI001A95D6C5|nr:class I SAM-dependent methyltransferase [Pseudogracilibacillus auburnensis]MBO1005423.1 class I SAM-dependent methyltransferase [Pseudogracilibacillus auburnensis]